MITDYIKNDSRVFKIKPYLNPYKKSPFKIMRQSFRHDGKGDRMQHPDGKFITEDLQVDAVLAPGVKQQFIVSRRRDNRLLATGLDVMVSNPYQDESYFPDEKFEKLLKGKEKVKLQYILEFEHGVPYDFYTSNIPDRLPAKNGDRKFFESNQATISLGNDILYLRMSNPIDRLMYYALTARNEGTTPMVALNFAELTENPKAVYCKWYFLDEEERQSVKLSKIERKNKIAFALESIRNSKKSEDLVTIAKVLEIEDARDLNLTPEKAYLLINDYAFSDVKRGDLFLDKFDIYKDKIRKIELEAEAEIFNFVNYGIIGYRNGKYEVQFKDKSGSLESKLFNSKGELARGFILDPAYKEQVDIFRESLKSKTQ